MDNEIFASVDKYLSGLFTKEDDALIGTQKSITESNIPQMSISPNQGKLLQLLAKISNAKKILEIGTLAGYSTIWMARALPKDGKLISIEFDPKHASVAKKNIEKANLSSIVEIRIGDGKEVLTKLEKEKAGPFDMIFIDADKPPYADYFELSLKLSRPGTLIVADNVIRNGKVLDKNTTDEDIRGIQRFNEMIGSNPLVTSTIIPTVGIKEFDGISISVVK